MWVRDGQPPCWLIWAILSRRFLESSCCFTESNRPLFCRNWWIAVCFDISGFKYKSFNFPPCFKYRSRFKCLSLFDIGFCIGDIFCLGVLISIELISLINLSLFLRAETSLLILWKMVSLFFSSVFSVSVAVYKLYLSYFLYIHGWCFDINILVINELHPFTE